MIAGMNDLSELLRRRVTLYRCYLREGARGDLARACLLQI